MKKNICEILILVGIILFAGCATPPKTRLASEYLLTSDLSVAVVLKSIEEKLASFKYKTQKSKILTKK